MPDHELGAGAAVQDLRETVVSSPASRPRGVYYLLAILLLSLLVGLSLWLGRWLARGASSNNGAPAESAPAVPAVFQ